MQQRMLGKTCRPWQVLTATCSLAGYYLPLCAACWGGRVLGLDALPGPSPSCCHDATCALPEGRVRG